MADVQIYHPSTEGVADVPEEAVWHYRQSGWVLLSEWQEARDTETAARQAEDNQKAAEKLPSKPAVAKKE